MANDSLPCVDQHKNRLSLISNKSRQFKMADDNENQQQNSSNTTPPGCFKRSKKFIISLLKFLYTLLRWALYYVDILSDIFQGFTLYSNCHYYYATVCLSIMVVSFFTTVFYVKFHMNSSWFEAFKYSGRFT